MLLPIVCLLSAVSASVVSAQGQSVCQTEILHNSTVDIDIYSNEEPQIITSFNINIENSTSLILDCTTACCSRENCSLAVYEATNNNTCYLIYCASNDACKPVAADNIEVVRKLKTISTVTTESTPKNDTQNVLPLNTQSLSQITEASSQSSRETTPSRKNVSTTTTTNTVLNTSGFVTGKNFTYLQMPTNQTQGYNGSLSSAPISSTESSTRDTSVNGTLSTIFGLSVSAGLLNQSRLSTMANASLMNSTDMVTTQPINVTDQNLTSTNPASINSSTTAFPSNSSGNISTASYTGMNTNYSGSTESFNTTMVIQTSNESHTQNYSTTNLNSNTSMNVNASVSVVANVTFLPTNNSTINPVLEPGNATNSTEFPNATLFKAESNLKDGTIGKESIMMSVLIGTLSIGTILFVAVIAVITKKVVDGWQRRHYSRIDYLVQPAAK
ncbi:uncharacterized protein DDB_G0271670-like isoform X1 [Argonauta hians]